ncbi:galactokinase family protein [Bacillus licheniformis]|nr:galactokinase family protein [Bacillus licheniformis]
MNTAAALSNDFRSILRQKDTANLFAPGRINLIGEHTDYNGGHVFPASISFGTYTLGVKRDDQMIRFYSKNFPDKGIIECSLSDLAFDQSDGWANYPKGMFL